MSTPRRARRTAAHRGFTLMEMLVTLVVVGFVIAILAQGLWQTAQIEKRLADVSFREPSAVLRQQWLRELLEGLMPTRANSPETLSGDGSRLQGFSVGVPAYPATVARRFELRLSTRPGGQEHLLEMRAPPEGEASQPLELLRWQGAAGRLRYRSPDGAWHDRWPPAPELAQSLPTLVMLESGHEQVRTLIVAPRATGAATSPRRAEMERM